MITRNDVIKLLLEDARKRNLCKIRCLKTVFDCLNKECFFRFLLLLSQQKGKMLAVQNKRIFFRIE